MYTKMSKLAVAIGTLMVASSAMAQSSATASGDASARVIVPITIAKDVALNFGNVVASAAGGTVLLTPSGVVTPTGVTIPATQKGTQTAATFKVTGETLFTYAITLPSSSVNLTDGATSPNTMAVGSFTVAAGTNGSVSAAVGTLTAGGLGDLNVGATLTLGANQVAGTYAGTFPVTVAYN